MDFITSIQLIDDIPPYLNILMQLFTQKKDIFLAPM